QALESVGLNGKIHRLPNQISGGEKERVAIARAVVNEPPVLLADEPTGNLDTKTTHAVMRLLQILNQEGMTIILVTHSAECAEYTRRILNLCDGRLVGENKPEKKPTVQGFKAGSEIIAA
ncbi:MAG: ATP-binding cassette domain-containing protein, partial [Desulfobulbaceae bacterium]|nr:ATP-binding cassette domain-containing protein [Desulfobulbaceae bacterium]